MTELINQVTKALQPQYQLVVSDIPEQYINVPQNTTKSTQCIEIRKDNETYIDFYDQGYFAFSSKSFIKLDPSKKPSLEQIEPLFNSAKLNYQVK